MGSHTSIKHLPRSSFCRIDLVQPGRTSLDKGRRSLMSQLREGLVNPKKPAVTSREDHKFLPAVNPLVLKLLKEPMLIRCKSKALKYRVRKAKTRRVVHQVQGRRMDVASKIKPVICHDIACGVTGNNFYINDPNTFDPQ